MNKKVYFFIRCTALSMTVFNLGCSTGSKSKSASSKPAIQKSAAVQALNLEQKKRASEEQRQNRKDQAKLLSKKSQIDLGRTRSSKSSKDLLKLEITESQLAQLSENDLYNELVLHSERNDEIGFQSRFQMFQSRFPQSSLRDDSIYLSGMMQVANKNYGPALQSMNEILKNYPYSNKVSSALFAKASIYKKMNLGSLARDVYQSVVVKYPGSPESLRAQNELRLIQSTL